MSTDCPSCAGSAAAGVVAPGPQPVHPAPADDGADGGVDERIDTGSVASTAPSRAAFWLVGLVLLTFLSASSAPSPLYVVFQQRWGFTALTLTTVFASYAVALLVTLVTVGGISDFVGRRPVLLAAVGLEAASLVVFLLAGDVAVLVAARVVQGVATGMAMSVSSAALVDLQPQGTQWAGMVNGAASTGGLAVGALMAGALAQFVPPATGLVFVVLLVAVAALAVPVWFLPETVERRPGALASLRPRLAVPPAARTTFVSVLPLLVATWSMGALYLSLGPSIAAQVLGLSGHLVGASVVALFTGAGAVSAVVTRDVAARTVMLVGASLLAVGTAVAVLAIDRTATGAFFVGSVVAGFGFGSGFLGAFRSLVGLAGPHQRAELLSAVYVVSYLAFSVPAVLAGLLVPVLGLTLTATAYGCVVAALAVVVLAVAAGGRLRRRIAADL